MVGSNPKFGMGHNFGKINFGLYFVKNRPKIDVDINTSSERLLSKLLENQKINVIRPTELRLWPFKDAQFNAVSTVFY